MFSILTDTFIKKIYVRYIIVAHHLVESDHKNITSVFTSNPPVIVVGNSNSRTLKMSIMSLVYDFDSIISFLGNELKLDNVTLIQENPPIEYSENKLLKRLPFTEFLHIK